MFENVLILCTGNICRSPMAEGLLAHYGQGSGLRVASAGTAAVVGWGADPKALALMQQREIDISSHLARQADAAILGAADLVLALDQSHLNWVARQFPQYKGRTHKLLKWVGDGDVPDPYQQPRAMFELAYQQIETGLKAWLAHLPITQ